jgi:hypothetical protein
MKRLSIYKNNVLTNQLDFETQEALEAGLAYHQSKNHFGVNAYSFEQEVTPAVPAVYEEQNGEQVEIQAAIPAEYETVNVSAEYTIQISDVTASLAQEAINAEAEAYLDETDKWATRLAETGVAMPEGVSAARAAARLRIIR